MNYLDLLQQQQPASPVEQLLREWSARQGNRPPAVAPTPGRNPGLESLLYGAAPPQYQNPAVSAPSNLLPRTDNAPVGARLGLTPPPARPGITAPDWSLALGPMQPVVDAIRTAPEFPQDQPPSAPPQRDIRELSLEDIGQYLMRPAMGASPYSREELLARQQELRSEQEYRSIAGNRPNQPRPQEAGDGGPPVEPIAIAASAAAPASTGPAEAPAEGERPLAINPEGVRQAGETANTQAALSGQRTPGPSGAAVTPGSPSNNRWSLSDIPMPDYGRVERLFNDARPEVYNGDPQKVWQMALLGALGNLQFTPGQRFGYGLVRAIPGGAQGAAQEINAQDVRKQQNQRDTRDWQRGLAGLVSQQEGDQYRNRVTGRTFERDSDFQQQQLSEGRARTGIAAQGLDIQRQEAALRTRIFEDSLQDRQTARLLSNLRVQGLLRQAGMEQDATSIIMQAIPNVVQNNSGLPPGFRLAIPGQAQPMSLGDARRHLTGMLTSPEAMRANPMLATQPQQVNRIVESQLIELVTENIALLPPDQRNALIQRLGAGLQRRAPQGTPVNFGDTNER